MTYKCRVLSVGVAIGLLTLQGGCRDMKSWFKPVTHTQRTPQTARAEAVTHTQEGQALKESGDLQAAMSAFRKALVANARHVPAHLGVGDVYQLLGDFRKAADAYENARDIDPNSFEANYKLAVMQQLLDEVRSAINNYLNALTINPDSFEANSNVAAAYSQIGQPGLARPYAEKAVRLQPAAQQPHVNLAEIYSGLGRDEEAIEEYRAAADRGDLPIPAAVNLVNALVRTGKYDRAFNTLQVLTRDHPKEARLFERLGYLHFRKGAYDESLRAYETALEINPDDPATLNGLGVNLMAQYMADGGKDARLRERAVQSWQRSVQINPRQGRIVDLISRYQNL
jgi:tetratricopeptide (TPR) repeat protein